MLGNIDSCEKSTGVGRALLEPTHLSGVDLIEIIGENKKLGVQNDIPDLIELVTYRRVIVAKFPEICDVDVGTLMEITGQDSFYQDATKLARY